jgi:hypothetical protein
VFIVKVTLESTTKIVELETAVGRVNARVWEGTTDSGIPVHAFVTRIAVQKDLDASQFERELQECRPPSRVIDETYPARMVL